MDEQLALALADRVSRLFSLPPPRLVFKPRLPAPGVYSRAEKTIYLEPGADERVLLHELAHYIHDAYGVSAPTAALEAWASVFEEVMSKRMGDYPYACPSCGSPLIPYGGPCIFCGYRSGDLQPCPVCGAPVKPGQPCPECGALSYPSPGVAEAALASTLILTLLYALVKGYTPPKTREEALELLRFAGTAFAASALGAALS